jgi:hypothetical protein
MRSSSYPLPIRCHHRNLDPVSFGHLDGFLVAGVHVADDGCPGVGDEHPLQSHRGLCRAVGDDDLTGVDGVANATPPPLWIETQVAPQTVLSRALSNGQSAMASELSRIPSASRQGEATEPPSR